MRSFYSESDLISAEVQSFYADGAIALHTRSLKYGKLENGRFMVVPPVLIKRVKQHFAVLPCNVHVILGNNGYIWISTVSESAMKREEGAGVSRVITVEESEAARKEHTETVIVAHDRERIARVANCIAALRYYQFHYHLPILSAYIQLSILYPCIAAPSLCRYPLTRLWMFTPPV